MTTGCAEPHLLAQQGAVPSTIVMVYAPRDRQGLDVVYSLVLASYRFAPESPLRDELAVGHRRLANRQCLATMRMPRS